MAECGEVHFRPFQAPGTTFARTGLVPWHIGHLPATVVCIVRGRIGLYVHVPFCLRRCPYCSFVSYEGRLGDAPGYVDALVREAGRQLRGCSIRTLYLGGGTPSLLTADQLQLISVALHSHADARPLSEFTVEANPGSVNEAYLSALRRCGVTRLSLGLQSLNDAELLLLGRTHTARVAFEAARAARRAGFDNLSLDLLYGLPGQSLASWRRTLRGALSLGPEHLSLYCLHLEHDVPMREAIEAGRLPQPDDDLAAAQYTYAEDVLEAHGYNHYEISNWARPGYECMHNLTYWHNRPYIGLGVAAHSYVDGRRTANTADLDLYLSHDQDGQIQESNEAISPGLEMAETIILGLRLGIGVEHRRFQRRFGRDMRACYAPQIQELSDSGLLQCDEEGMRLTRIGRLLGNEVFCRFLP